MQLFNKTNLANTEIAWLEPILSKFSSLSSAKAISAIDYFVVPVGGDRSYVILQFNKELFALVTADYPEPLHDAGELKELSGRYTFNDVTTPEKGRLINVKDVESDNVGDDYFVRLGENYCYCAQVKFVNSTK